MSSRSPWPNQSYFSSDLKSFLFLSGATRFLSDPEVYILTDDERLKTRCLPSPQADRIIVL